MVYLTYRPPGAELILNMWFTNALQWFISLAYPKLLLSDDWHMTVLMKSQNWSGNGLVPSGNKLLPEPMLTQVNVAFGFNRPKCVKPLHSHISIQIFGTLTQVRVYLVILE